jgi:hypothetical protein
MYQFPSLSRLANPVSWELRADSSKGANGSTLHALETLLIPPSPDDGQAEASSNYPSHQVIRRPGDASDRATS